MKIIKPHRLVLAAICLSLSINASADSANIAIDNVIIGSDNNSAENPFVQPQDPALAGGGRDQTMQFGDILFGKRNTDDLIIGGLGTDIISGRGGDDVLIGGIEHFNPLNRDRAFGGPGDDIFIWKPGDGSDLFRGGKGNDVIVFGITGESVGGVTRFEVLNDQQTAEVALRRRTKLPKVDVTNSPGFCQVTDKNSEPGAKQELKALDINHLAKFFIRSVADSFEQGNQFDDNGLRVTLHLKNVEYLVCTQRNGNLIEVLDLRQSPPVSMNLRHIQPEKLRKRLRRIVK